MKLPRRPAMTIQRWLLLVVVLVQSTLTLMLVAGQESWGGPVILGISHSHGLHVTDIPLVALWMIGMLCCGALWVKPHT
jgi:predicted anti-sigma-YlaC factor YlaD